MHKATFEERLAEEARRLKEQAKKVAAGREREELLRKAREAVHSSSPKWATSMLQSEADGTYIIGPDGHIRNDRSRLR